MLKTPNHDRWEQNQRKKVALTKTAIDKIVEGVSVAVVSELVVAGRQLLKTLRCDWCEIPSELRVFCKNYSAACDRGVDQRFLPHFSLNFFCRSPPSNSLFLSFTSIDLLRAIWDLSLKSSERGSDREREREEKGISRVLKCKGNGDS